jgi:arylsulfatase A-like enzyme
LIDQVDPDKINQPVFGNGWDERFNNDTGCGGADAWCGEFDKSEVNISKRYYHANLNFVDEQVGLIIDSLDRKGVLNNTIFFFTSDHGDMQSDHYLWRKGYPFEGSTHIPMIMSWPKELEK